MRHQILDHRQHRLSVPDVRALLRLCNELHVTRPEWEDRKLRLLHGLRELTGADRASAAVATFPVAGRGGRNVGATNVISLVELGHDSRRPGSARAAAGAGAAGPAGSACLCPWHAYKPRPARKNATRSLAKSAPASASAISAATAAVSADWCMTLGVTAPRVPAAAPAAAAATPRREHCVHSFLPLSDGRVVACLSVGRRASRAGFSHRERSMVCVLHAEAAWVYHADVMLVSPAVRGLSRRELETLQHLLIGKSEKQIADDMGVSHNTVHHYVKALHRHFDVSTRAELLARWVR
jgi:DNA-binding CsgD family transcriptional regulator